VEREDEYKGSGKLNAIIVYGCTPSVLHQAPGGRDNARVVTKPTFSGFSLESGDGSYFLRRDRILGVFEVDPERPPELSEEADAKLEVEITNEQLAWSTFELAESKSKANIQRIDKAITTLGVNAAHTIPSHHDARTRDRVFALNAGTKLRRASRMLGQQLTEMVVTRSGPTASPRDSSNTDSGTRDYLVEASYQSDDSIAYEEASSTSRVLFQTDTSLPEKLHEMPTVKKGEPQKGTTI